MSNFSENVHILNTTWPLTVTHPLKPNKILLLLLYRLLFITLRSNQKTTLFTTSVLGGRGTPTLFHINLDIVVLTTAPNR